MIRDFLKIFLGFLLSTGMAHGAAFQFGGLRLDSVVVTSGATTTQLVKSDAQVRTVTGSTTDTEKLPVATGLQAGYWYSFINKSTGSVAVQDSAGSSLSTLTAGQSATYYLTSAGTSAGTWSIFSGAGSGGGGGGSAAAVLIKTTDYTVSSSDFTGARLLVEMNCAAACALTFPSSSGVSGYAVYAVNVGNAVATVTMTSGDTFGSTGDTTWTLIPGGSPNASNEFVANGVTRWNGF